MSNIPRAYVKRIQRMPSVSSVCLAYYERMSNVLSIRSHTLIKFFKHEIYSLSEHRGRESELWGMAKVSYENKNVRSSGV